MNDMNSIACNLQSAKNVRAVFAKSGISIAEWARAEGFSIALVYQVIEGKRPCIRGQSYRIAIALGLKEGTVCDLAELKERLARLSAGVQAQPKEAAM